MEDNKIFSVTMTEEELSLFSEFLAEKDFAIINPNSRMHSTNNFKHNMNSRMSVGKAQPRSIMMNKPIK